jgi:hypothetical protein
MSEFDDALRESLRRQSAPDGLAGRVLAQARAMESRRRAPPSSWGWALSGAAVLVLSIAPLVYVQRLRTVEGERAREQALSALRVAGTSLRSVQARVAEVAGAARVDEGRPEAPLR